MMRPPLIVVPNPSAELELHQQIVSQICDQIVLGQLKPGDRIETIAELQEKLGLAHATVSRAFLQLRDSGIITTARRGGSTVAELSSAALRDLRIDYARRTISSNVLQLRRLQVRPAEILRAFKLVLESFAMGSSAAE